MKKSIFIFMLLIVFLSGCNLSNNTNKDDPTEILDKYGNVIQPITDLKEEISFEYKKYLGEYEGYHVLLKYFSSSWGDIECFAVNEMIFCIHDTYSISLYKEEETISLIDAIEANLLKEESIRNIHYYYNKYIIEESEQGYAAAFNNQINLMEMLNTYYVLVNGEVTKYETLSKLNHVSLETLKLAEIDKTLSSKLSVEFDYGNYLGLFDGKYHLYLLEDESGLEAIELRGYKFINDSKFRLVAVYNDEIVEVSKLIEDGKMTVNDVMKLAFNFKIIQREYTYHKLNDKEFRDIYKY